MKKFFVFLNILLSLLIISSSLLIDTAYAVCPACTLAIGAGLGLSRYLGVDDVISGIWIGALILSSSLWLINWLNKSKFKYKSKYLDYLIIFAMYLLVLLPLTLTNLIGHPFNRIWGIDKLIFGTVAGTAAFLAGIWLDKKVRQVRGKQLFNYQKIVFPVSLLLLSSILIWIIIKNY